jgi:tetratricopeptide (TPR) repeat protein
MLSSEGLSSKLIARVRAITSGDWQGRAGKWFRKAVAAISDFATEHHVTPSEIADTGVELGRRKLEGLANHEFAEATRNFADAEKTKMDIALQRRGFESDARKKDAEACRAEAEARIAEMSAVSAEIDLLRKLQEAGVVLRKDQNGNLTVLPSLPGVNLLQLAEHRQLEAKINDPAQSEGRERGVPDDISRFERDLAIARESGDRQGESVALGNLGFVYELLGKHRRAIEYYGQRLAVTRQIGDRQGEGYAHWKMSLALEKLGERGQAIAHAEVALSIYEQIEDPSAAKVRTQIEEWRRES